MNGSKTNFIVYLLFNIAEGSYRPEHHTTRIKDLSGSFQHFLNMKFKVTPKKKKYHGKDGNFGIQMFLDVVFQA